MSTQLERVEAALQYAGAAGITAYDFSGPSVIDGGNRIMRVAARILELKAQGRKIEKAGRRDGHDVYVLRQDVGVGLVSSNRSWESGEADTGTLFQLPAPQPAGAYDWDAA